MVILSSHSQDGELVPAFVAQRSQVLYTLSSLSTTSLEDAAIANGTGMRIFQLYVLKVFSIPPPPGMDSHLQSREMTLKLVRRAEAAGYTGLALTVRLQFIATHH